MTVAILSEVEGLPAEYPVTPVGTNADALEGDLFAIWQRIEAWIAHRFATRSLEVVVEGPGDWEPRLTPVTFSTIEKWTEGAWQAVILGASPLGGFVLPGIGPYRFTGTAGDDSIPPWAVQEAFRRLANYWVAEAESANSGASVIDESFHDIYSRRVERAPAWLARSMSNSGAADLLRPYRRLS